MFSRAPHRRWFALLAAVVALALVACTDATDGEITPTTTAPTPTTAVPTTTGLVTLETLLELPPESPVLQRNGPADAIANETATAISYMSGGHRITGVLRTPDVQEALPTVVVVHGGVDPERYTSGGDLLPEQRALLDRGYAVLAIDMRGYAGSDPADVDSLTVDPGFGWLTVLDWGMALDVVNAARLLRSGAVAESDPARVGLLGHSLGGLLVLDAAVIAPGQSDVVVALAAAPSDFPEAFRDIERQSPGTLDEISEVLGEFSIDSPYWDDVSPRRHFDRVTEPLLMIHGTADDATLPEWSRATAAAWQETGTRAAVAMIDGGDHHFAPHRTESVKLTVDAFDAVIGR